MKKVFKKRQNVSKGKSSALILSILIHVALFLLAGMLVVFTVVTKEEQVFEPPKAVERPKMKLKKPKVKVKKSSKPKSASRITAKTTRSIMPSNDLPELGGMGAGLGEGIGADFGLMPDLDVITIFGSGQTIGNDFVGTFCDFKRLRTGTNRSMHYFEFIDKVARFVQSGFDTSKLDKYYRSPKKLYATCFMVPTVRSSVAPAAFGEPDTGGWCWMVHYKGKLVHKDGIKFRFWGAADDILVVRVDGKIVLNGSIGWNNIAQTLSNWQSNNAKSKTYKLGNPTSVVGDWITLEPGVPLDMEVLCGEVPGGHFSMMLVVEEEGVEYEKNYQNGPILPMFKTEEPNHDAQDRIYELLVEGEAAVTGGPVFNDFGAVGSDDESIPAAAVEPVEIEPVEKPPESTLRTWTMKSGQTLEAEYISSIGEHIVLRSVRGKQIKVPASKLTSEDHEYIALSNPPKFNISFTKQSSQHLIVTSPYLNEEPPRTFDWRFGVKMKQVSAGEYGYPLTVEVFTVGRQYMDDRKYILFDRQTTTFTPTKENDRSLVFKGEETVELTSYNMYQQQYGNKYMGYLVTVTDARGEIIQHQTSNDWLFERLPDLKQLEQGWFFDRMCKRAHPTGPKRYY
jgi:hypothetical protein